MRPRVKEILLTATILAMVASATPPGTWAQDQLLVPAIFPELSAQGIFSCQEVLSVDDVSGETVVRVTEQEFDESGRVIAVWSGPALPDSDRVDPSQARREIGLRYEMETGRVEMESYGGLYGEPPLYARTFGYHAENQAPWADEVTYSEAVATRSTRDGIELTLSYDAANRLESIVPSLAGGSLPASLVALDAGDFYDYDVLSRLKEARRGSTSGGGADPALTVAYSSYDLASRPAAESVGSRAALAWKYDVWDRPEEVVLPAGVGRSSGGDFSGFQRQYDTLDRIADISGLGQLTTSPLGASWSWGGADRLYGFTTKAQLGTAARFGYIDGRGAQPPGGEGDTSSQWRLGTLTWGSTADDVPGVSATSRREPCGASSASAGAAPRAIRATVPSSAAVRSMLSRAAVLISSPAWAGRGSTTPGCV